MCACSGPPARHIGALQLLDLRRLVGDWLRVGELSPALLAAPCSPEEAHAWAEPDPAALWSGMPLVVPAQHSTMMMYHCRCKTSTTMTLQRLPHTTRAGSDTIQPCVFGKQVEL